MYALISVYDDTNKCVCKDKVLTPSMVNHDGKYTTYRFGFATTISENQAPTMNGKFKHDDIPEPETNECMDKGPDQVYEDAKRAANKLIKKLVDNLDNAPKSVKNKCMICGSVIRDDKVICDKCYVIARREGLLL